MPVPTWGTAPPASRILATRPRAHWLALFQAARIPAGPINRIDEIARDPTMRERGTWMRATISSRRARRSAFEPKPVSAAASGSPTACQNHWLALFQAARIPAGPINRIDEIARDPTMRERGMIFVELDAGADLGHRPARLAVDAEDHPALAHRRVAGSSRASRRSSPPARGRTGWRCSRPPGSRPGRSTASTRSAAASGSPTACQNRDHRLSLPSPSVIGRSAVSNRREEIVARIQAILATRPRAHWLALFQAARIPAGPIKPVSAAASGSPTACQNRDHRLSLPSPSVIGRSAVWSTSRWSIR
jgi:crotonobetainyl-CoA:carnitine CoA-transferase CaiB-like acyl-CoA transferase